MTDQPQPLSHHLARRLLSYATAAAAVSACTPAAAEVVYTPVYRNIHLNYHLDLNNDGIIDFLINSSQLSSVAKLEVFPEFSGTRNRRSINNPSHFDRSGAFAKRRFGAVEKPAVFPETEERPQPWA